jgi:hypothetical protein
MASRLDIANEDETVAQQKLILDGLVAFVTGN